jgi:transcriptional regulator with XRE-family HTH domain
LVVTQSIIIFVSIQQKAKKNSMSERIIYLASNMKVLRNQKGKSQEDMAAALGMSRAKLNSYENSIRTNMPPEDLIRVAEYFNLSIDALLKHDLSQLSAWKLRELQAGNDVFVTGTKLRVLATTVDRDNNDNIEVVGLRAKAGYQMGFFDPEFIGSLPKFQMPVLTTSYRKYRMFQIDGDSMLPIPDKSYVLAEYVENWNDIKDDTAYVVLTKQDGLVFKILLNEIKLKQQLIMRSLNPIYQDYSVKIGEVQEVWKFISYISTELPEGGLTKERIANILKEVQSVVVKMKD